MDKTEKRKKIFEETKNILLVLLGSFFVALGSALFLVPCNIISGGVSSIAIILNYFLYPILNFDVTDIVIFLSQAILWVIGLIVLGKKFSYRTLIASFAYPLLYSLLLRTNVLEWTKLSNFYAQYTDPNGKIELVALLMAGIFGGGLGGLGIALSYFGKGSTGGIDIICVIIAKSTSIKQDKSQMFIDSFLVIVGFLCFLNWQLLMIGILTAFACAFILQAVYVGHNPYLIFEIISSHTEEIMEYIHKDLEHATTIIPVKGGYTGADRKLIKVVVYKTDLPYLKEFIASKDPKAFITITQAKTINGEGFDPLLENSNDYLFTKNEVEEEK